MVALLVGETYLHELFLVWSQGVNSGMSTSNGLFEDFGTGVLNQRPQNIFLLKATYRFVL